MKYKEIMWATHHPDVYGGEKCNELIPYWSGSSEGSMDGEIRIGKDVKLSAKTFPPGTKITISVPLCPVCEKNSEFYWDYELLKFEKCRCDFDWDAWCINEFC